MRPRKSAPGPPGRLLARGGAERPVQETAECLCVEIETRQTRKRFLLILSARIRDSRVERAMPSRTAAPAAPDTRPPLARKASSIIALSRANSAPDRVDLLLGA